MFPSEESVASSWYDEHLQMTSTIAQHGFCFYAKEISTIGSKMGSNARVDLTWEMISSTTNMMALGKLSGQNVESSGISNIGNGLELSPAKSEILLERYISFEFLVTFNAHTLFSFLTVDLDRTPCINTN